MRDQRTSARVVTFERRTAEPTCYARAAPIEVPMITDPVDPQTRVRAALQALLDWGCCNTSPLDPASPHALLIEARAALEACP
jgi:hypothetical protein